MAGLLKTCALFLVLIGLPLVGHSETISWQYKNTTYPTLPQAEAAMRADIGAGSQDMRECTTATGPTSAVLNYCTNTGIASYWFAQFTTSATMPPGACSHSNEALSSYCVSESEMASVYFNAYFSNNPSYCPQGSVYYTGGYRSPPYTNWVVSTYPLAGGGWGRYITVGLTNPYGSQRYAYQDYVPCSNPQGAVNHVSTNIIWNQNFRCAPGYAPQYPVGDFTLFPYACKGPTATIYKLAAETTNSVPNTGCPCVPATGEKLWFETDLTFGRLTFSRFYNTLHERASGSGLGPRWSHSWNESLTPPSPTASNPVGLWRNDHNDLEQFQFVSNSSTQMKSVTASGRTLTKNADGSWLLLDPDGTRRNFSAAGQLQSIVHPDDHTRDVELTWTNGMVATAADYTGRTLNFVYDTASHLIRIDAAGSSLVSFAYGSSGSLDAVAYADGNGRGYLYGETNHLCINAASGCQTGDFPNHLTGVYDERLVRILTIDYEGSGRVTEMTRPAGASATALTYSSVGQQSTVTKVGEGVVNYAFEATTFRRPTSKATYDGSSLIGTETWEYPTSLAYTRYTNRNGVATLSNFDATTGQVASVVEAEKKGSNTSLTEKRITSYTWTSTTPARVATQDIANATGTVVLHVANTYNTRGQVISRATTDPGASLTRTTAFDYCETGDANCPFVGLLKSVTAPGGAVTQFLYRAADDQVCATTPVNCGYRRGDLQKEINAVGLVTEVLASDPGGHPTSVKDPNGVVIDLVYDARGRGIQKTVHGATSSDDAVTKYTWTADGTLASITDPDNVVLTIGYDDAGRAVSTPDGAGNKRTLTLDGAGHPTAEAITDASNVVRYSLSRSYDGIGRLKTVASAAGGTTSFTYDANGNPLTSTDAASVKTQNSYDALDRMVSTVQDVGGIGAAVSLQYDTLDNVTSVVDPKGLTTGYSYNSLGDLLQLTSPDTGVTGYTYNAAGQLSTRTDARGVVATYTHDGIGRVTSVSYSTGSTDNAVWTYDVAPSGCQAGETFAAGHVSTMTDGSGSTAWCYDNRGNVVRKVQATGNVILAVRYGYTKGDRLAWMIYPDGTRVDYSHDALGNISAVNTTRPLQYQQGLISSVAYMPFGSATSIAYAGGRTQSRVFDTAGRPSQVTDGTTDGVSIAFGYNQVDSITALTLPSTGAAPTRTLTYDNLSRVTGAKNAAGAQLESYSYDATGNRVSFSGSDGTQAYTYPTTSHKLSDVAGTGRTYDAAGNTLTIGAKTFTYNAAGRMATASSAGTLQSTYTYTGAGEQVSRIAGGATTIFLYNEDGQLLGQYTGAGTLVQQYVWLDTLPVGVETATQMLHVQADHLGTPRAVIDPTRNVAIWKWSIDSEAFGATPPNEDPDGDGTVFTLDLRFPGQRFDVASGLNQNYFRDGYDSLSGRYSQSDPSILNGGISTYAYVESSPFDGADWYGLAECNYTITKNKLTCVASEKGHQNVDIRVASGNNGHKQQCKDNPECIKYKQRGPIPVGKWKWNIDGPGAANSKQNGRRLVPLPGTETYGRSAILTHSCANAFGPSLGPKFCSEGCVTGSSSDIKKLNALIDAEPDSVLTVEP
ncbi:RHS repeat-associated core domain-containing protein [Solilutibacter silvestris]|uniref:RHS domain-containing protein n=1 Tax=Solilutibacter silvestris TaxID=1645665 RepID=A0A2K1Q245_9GAMM|nr:RHS repeat-associated core domain-containing protein [Lysobacter silvestris]PNS09104.1 RHS domain-containing protein [Lysobacter silvestris]